MDSIHITAGRVSVSLLDVDDITAGRVSVSLLDVDVALGGDIDETCGDHAHAHRTPAHYEGVSEGWVVHASVVESVRELRGQAVHRVCDHHHRHEYARP